MVPPGNTAALAAALRRILVEPGLAASLRSGALLEVANHDPDRVASAIIATLDQLTRTPEPAGRSR
jgi:glycosyltransferase involved in cell wall biosynthesis